MTPRRAAAVFAALALLTLSACTGGGGTGKTRVAFVSNNPEEFWTICEAGCRKAEAETGVEVIFKKPPKGEAAEQRSIIKDLVLSGVKGIAVSVIDPANQSAELDETAARIPLLCVDNDAPLTQRICYIGTDNYAAGKGVGQLVKEQFPDGATVAVFVGRMTALNAQQRRQGVMDELAGQKDVKGPQLGKYNLKGGGPESTDAYTDNNDHSKARANGVDVLSQTREADRLALVGLWAYNPPALLTALNDFNDPKKAERVRIAGMDEDFTTLRGIEDGKIAGTVVQDPYGFGYESVKLLAALTKGDRSGVPADKIKYVPHRVLTKDGGPGKEKAKDFRENLEKLLGKK